MILKKLLLKGVRSWEKGEITFEEGFTVIVGAKGAGKSSIITAVEFALFGEEAFRNYNGFMREGVNSSEAILHLEDKDKQLVITRSLLRDGNSISQDSRGIRLEVDGIVHTVNKAGDLNRDIKNLLRIDSEFLEHTCLSKQEELKHLLNMDARYRKRAVDELLGFNVFENTWEELGDIIRGRESYLKRVKEESSRYDLKSLVSSYDDTLQQMDTLKSRSKKIENEYKFEKEKLDYIQLELKAFDKDFRDYNEIRREIETKRKQLADGIAKSEGFKGKIASFKQNLSEFEEEKKQLEERIRENWINLENIGYIEEKNIFSLKKRVEILNESIGEILETVIRNQKTVEDEESIEEVISSNGVCPYCGQPLTSHEAKEFRDEKLKHLEELRVSIQKNNKDLNLSRQLLKIYSEYTENFDRAEDRLERIKNRINNVKIQIADAEKEANAVQSINNIVENQVKMAEASLPIYDEAFHIKKREEWKEQLTKVGGLEREIQQFQNEFQRLGTAINDLVNKIEAGRKSREEADKYETIIDELNYIRGGCRAVLPTLRMQYLKTIEHNIQRIYNELNPSSSFMIKVDENYTPTVSVGNHKRSYQDISGGERTEIALAYRIGLGNTIYEARTGTSMDLLILDEPTENLGNEEEDRAIEYLAQMLSRLKIRQIIVITHDENFIKFADNTIKIKKFYNSSTMN